MEAAGRGGADGGAKVVGGAERGGSAYGEFRFRPAGRPPYVPPDAPGNPHESRLCASRECERGLRRHPAASPAEFPFRYPDFSTAAGAQLSQGAAA